MNWVHWSLRRSWAELEYLGVRAGYWFRPYDAVLDDRRWRWQESGCSRQRRLTEHLRRELEDAGIHILDEDPQ